jgi:hypothetical protein
VSAEPWDLRLSNAEREEAMDVLGEHVSTGRLDIDEFGSRSARIGAAARVSDLIPLFEDLPAPKPSVLLANRAPVEPVRRTATAPQRMLTASAIPIAIVLAIALLFETHNLILALVLPAALALFLGRRRH